MPRTLAVASRIFASSAVIALAVSAFSANAAPQTPPACQTEPCAFLDKSLTPEARALSAVDGNGVRKVRSGAYTVHVGGGQPGHTVTVKANLKVSGTASVPK